MLLLAIDTSGSQGGIALLDDDQLIAEHSLQLDHKASTTLLPAIDQLLKTNQLAQQDLGALAVSLGPGSFTGIRIGLATAQGIAQALDISVYGLSSLRVLADQCQRASGSLAVLRRARDGECYFCVYDDGWEETVPEGRYPDHEIIGMLRELTSLQIVLEEGADFDCSWSEVSAQNVTLQAVSLGRLAHRLSPDFAVSRGEGLAPRHYSPSFRTKKS